MYLPYLLYDLFIDIYILPINYLRYFKHKITPYVAKNQCQHLISITLFLRFFFFGRRLLLSLPLAFPFPCRYILSRCCSLPPPSRISISISISIFHVHLSFFSFSLFSYSLSLSLSLFSNCPTTYIPRYYICFALRIFFFAYIGICVANSCLVLSHLILFVGWVVGSLIR